MKPKQNYPNATTKQDEANRMVDALEQRLDRYRLTCDTLRASLHDLEKRHEETKLALEVAQRERDTAEQMLRDCRARCERMKTMEGLSIDECAARQLWAEQSRDAALAQAAGLRGRVAELEALLRTMGVSA
jgi:septal ring factor EnvC (AmiA/AmiB activator)